MALTSLRALPVWQKARQVSEEPTPLDFYCEDRCGHNAVCIKEELLVWGGYHERSIGSMYCEKKILWSFNLDLDSWYRVTTYGKGPEFRSGACSALIWPRWYIMCGHTYDGDVNDVHALNLITLRWEKIQVPTRGVKAIAPRDKATAWAHENSRIYIFGGYGMKPYAFMWSGEEDKYTLEVEFGRGWNDQIVYLDVEKKCWVRPQCQGPKPKSRAAHATIYVEGDVYLFGGRHQSERMNDLHRFNVESHRWSGTLCCLGTLPEGRTWHTLSRASKTDLLMYGGFNVEQKPLDDAWLLNMETLSWSVLSRSTGFPRLWHTASTNPHGDVLIFGGCENNILDEETSMITSRKVLLLRTKPFSLERLCLHCMYTQRSVLRPQWECLPRQFQEWLQAKEKVSEEMKPPISMSNVVLGQGPSLSQLSIVTKSEAQGLNDDQDFANYLFHAF
ncbi:kelch domain-containing protein 2 [Aplysia californica]|uniref:Kelch domain-containing protein 2 n=1 Tax=Aplysia californica TaxID=6500 RepID=A0ABM1VVQ1_APLCA|nr:kelch domain-containing protein 2 [Aplysia californica]XP_005101715.1 kelch domain-containing protein 2 [Aplysia californica]XP_035826493.1 kelch domain-containing protein 2 [Aplysia californica]